MTDMVFRKMQFSGGGNLSAGTNENPRRGSNVITDFPPGVDFSANPGDNSYEGGLPRESGMAPLTTAGPWGLPNAVPRPRGIPREGSMTIPGVLAAPPESRAPMPGTRSIPREGSMTIPGIQVAPQEGDMPIPGTRGIQRQNGMTASDSWGIPSQGNCVGCGDENNNLYMRDLLEESIGYYIISEHLLGTGSLQYRTGLLTRVEGNCFVLYQEDSKTNMICDYYTLKFFRRWAKGEKPQIRDSQAYQYLM